VTRVVDGDTIVVDDGERVRLIGIDTPESVKPDSPVECFGLEASRRLSQLLPVGIRVDLVADVEPTDRYDRTLAYVYLPDGRFVNGLLVSEGFAFAYTVPPNVAHADELVRLQGEARAADRGLWSACPVG
jgi:micrococcal nuclease